MHSLRILLAMLDALTVAYVGAHFFLNMVMIAVSLASIGRDLRAEHVSPASRSVGNRFLPHITLLVPAYNEEVTIVESIRSLLKLQYPSFEIVICNDGSKDRTMEVLRRAFHFVRTELEENTFLPTSKVRAFYEARTALPPGLTRMILIDKENGGKADALNAAINLAQGDYVTSMDADSLLIPEALLLAARVIVESKVEVVAVGAQVGLSNGSVVEGGRVIEMRIPKSWIARFQIVEYMRSFAQGRVAFAAFDSLLILSGVFALMKRDLVLRIGGFLTSHMKARVALEYCGKGAHTVCEDMEIVVRLHRYLRDKGLPGKVTMLPFPTAWTEAPENLRDLGKQRSRWYRGLLEVLVYHRGVIFRRRFGAVGMFSLPYQLLFEALAPVFECVGYLSLVFTAIVGVVSLKAVLSFLALATAANQCLSTLSVLLCIYSERGTKSHVSGLALFPYASSRDALMLLLSGFIAQFGYRQYLVVWQLKGLIDYLKGKKGWDKFARKGFHPKQA